jgi:hypothetical protein
MWRDDMDTVIQFGGFIFLLLQLSFLATCSANDVSRDLPPHEIAKDTSLAPKNGRRIEIHVNDPSLTRDQCTSLINAYRSKAGPQGQVSVRKPSTAQGGGLQPWCVDNMDKSGVTFNDFYFSNSPGNQPAR